MKKRVFSPSGSLFVLIYFCPFCRYSRRIVSMRRHLVFVGGGHAHLTALKNLGRYRALGHQVTLIGPSPYHYYSGMGPGMLSGTYRPQQVRFHIKKMAEDRGAAFKQGKVIRIDPDHRRLFLSSGEEVPYDVASFNTGSDVSIGSLGRAGQENIFPVKPVINLLEARRKILDAFRDNKPLRLAVIGGGAAGIEISGNLCRLMGENQGRGRIILIAGKRLMADAPEKVRDLAMETLHVRGVEIIEGRYGKAIEEESVVLDDGSKLRADVVFVAVGIKPSSLFRDSGLPTGKDGGLLVNAYLQSVVHPEIFGGGDCINLEGHDLAKVGVYAVRENPILYHNLRAALENEPMKSFVPQKTFLLIFNMGNRKGIFWKENWVWDGRLAFLLKNYVDQSFMKKFQVSGERDEQA
jgi:NADH dehydrogenase FAD-containing subunit